MIDLIPLHNFAKDDRTSIPFNYIPLEKKTDYDHSMPHRHNYYEIFFFTEGGGIHEIDFQEFEIASRSIHYVSPGQVHHVRRGIGSEGFVMLFSRDFYYLNLQNKRILFDLPFLNNNTDEPILNLTEAEFEIMSRLTEMLSAEHQSDNPMKEEIMRSYLNIVLINCKRLFYQYNPEHAEVFGTKLFQDFRIQLENDFATFHKVSDYAQRLSVTEKHLNETTKKTVGKTASELIHDRIILEAKRLIVHSDHSNKEIAYFLHFDDPSHFSKFFKNKVGVSPNEFKKA
jgi:AraC family transcriptional activator of pobA